MAGKHAPGDRITAMIDQPRSQSPRAEGQTTVRGQTIATTEPELLILNPDHDLEIIIVTTENKVVKRVRLLRKILCVASPVWRVMLAPGGPFVESTSCSIRFEEEYPDELALLLSLTHSQCAKIPTTVSFDELFGLAVTCDKYDVGSLVRPFYAGWVGQLRPLQDGDVDVVEWCFIARVFQDHSIFSVAVERLVLSVSFDPRSEQCFTSGGVPIRDLTPMSEEWVNEWRTHILGRVLRVCDRFLKKLAGTADPPDVCQNGGDGRSRFKSFDTCHRCRLPVKNVCRFEFQEGTEGFESCVATQLWHFVQSMRSLRVPIPLQRLSGTNSGQIPQAQQIDSSVADFVDCFSAIVFQTWPGHEDCSIQTDFSLAIYSTIRHATSNLAWKFVSSFPTTDMANSPFEGSVDTCLAHRYQFRPEDFANEEPKSMDSESDADWQESRGNIGESDSESEESLDYDENLDPMDFEEEMQEVPGFGVADMLG